MAFSPRKAVSNRYSATGSRLNGPCILFCRRWGGARTRANVEMGSTLQVYCQYDMITFVALQNDKRHPSTQNDVLSTIGPDSLKHVGVHPYSHTRCTLRRLHRHGHPHELCIRPLATIQSYAPPKSSSSVCFGHHTLCIISAGRWTIGAPCCMRQARKNASVSRCARTAVPCCTSSSPHG